MLNYSEGIKSDTGEGALVLFPKTVQQTRLRVPCLRFTNVSELTLYLYFNVPSSLSSTRVTEELQKHQRVAFI